MTAVAALTDRARREIYAWARRQGRPVTRDEAAAHLGFSRKLAAFHLDKLVAAGLLTARVGQPVEPRRVGRPPKTYEPADAEIQVSVPARRYDLVAQILIDAVVQAEAAGVRARDATLLAARSHGADLGRAERTRLRGGAIGPERTLSLVEPLPRMSGTNRSVRSQRAEASQLSVLTPGAGLTRRHLRRQRRAVLRHRRGIGGTVGVELTPWTGHYCVQLTA